MIVKEVINYSGTKEVVNTPTRMFKNGAPSMKDANPLLAYAFLQVENNIRVLNIEDYIRSS